MLFPCLLQHGTRNLRGHKFWPSHLFYFVGREVTIKLLNFYPHRDKMKLGKEIIRIYFKATIQRLFLWISKSVNIKSTDVTEVYTVFKFFKISA